MSEEKENQEIRYPLRSLHDFLSELDKEWDRFRTGSLIGLIVSGALLMFSTFRLLSLSEIEQFSIGNNTDNHGYFN